MDLVKLTLESKMLQWRKEGMPKIPFLLEQRNNRSSSPKLQSSILDLWRLWHQEVDHMNFEFTPADIIQLMTEAENSSWEPSSIPTMHNTLNINNDLNAELMPSINSYFEINQQIAQNKEVDSKDILRLVQEASVLIKDL